MRTSTPSHVPSSASTQSQTRTVERAFRPSLSHTHIHTHTHRATTTQEKIWVQMQKHKTLSMLKMWETDMTTNRYEWAKNGYECATSRRIDMNEPCHQRSHALSTLKPWRTDMDERIIDMSAPHHDVSIWMSHEIRGATPYRRWETNLGHIMTNLGHIMTHVFRAHYDSCLKIAAPYRRWEQIWISDE